MFRSKTERKVLNPPNKESAIAQNLSAVAICRAEKKEDKTFTDDTIVDIQESNLFLSM